MVSMTIWRMRSIKAVGKECQMPQQRHPSSGIELTAARPAAKMDGLLVEAEVRTPCTNGFLCDSTFKQQLCASYDDQESYR